MKDFTLIIPTHNEETILVERALTSLLSQRMQDINFHLIVIPNGCKDATAINAKSFLEKNSPDFSWEIVELAEGHRSKALNHGISISNTELIMYLNPDCVFSTENALRIFYEELTSDARIKYACLFGTPDRDLLPSEKRLHDLILLLNASRIFRPGLLIPEGRVVGFRRSAISKFPEIHSEDTWASLYCYKTFGPESIKVFFEPYVKFITYQNWVDCIKTESRYLEGTEDVFVRYPDLREVNKQRVALNSIPTDVIQEKLLIFCKENDIDQAYPIQIKDIILPMIRENSRIHRQISASGSW